MSLVEISSWRYYSNQISISYPSGSRTNAYGRPGPNSPCELMVPPALLTATIAASIAFGPGQSEPEVNDAAAHARVIRASLKSQDVMGSRSECLNRVGVAKIFPNAEYRGVEAQRSFRIAYRQSQVRQAVGLDHGRNRGLLERRCQAPRGMSWGGRQDMRRAPHLAYSSALGSRFQTGEI